MTILKDTAFTVRADSTGRNTTSFRLYLDGVVVDTQPLSALVAGQVSFDRPAGLPEGAHTVVVSAVGSGGEVKAPVLAVVAVSGVPDAPTNVVILGAVAPPTGVDLG